MRILLMLLVLLAFSVSGVSATTWECNSGVHWGTGVTSGDWVRSCLGSSTDMNSSAYDLWDSEDSNTGEDDDDEDVG